MPTLMQVTFEMYKVVFLWPLITITGSSKCIRWSEGLKGEGEMGAKMVTCRCVLNVWCMRRSSNYGNQWHCRNVSQPSEKKCVVNMVQLTWLDKAPGTLTARIRIKTQIICAVTCLHESAPLNKWTGVSIKIRCVHRPLTSHDGCTVILPRVATISTYLWPQM